jgi:hypothetical protein
MLNRHTVWISVLTVIAAMVVSTTSQATAPLTEVNNLTFGSRVALPGVTLAAGTYVFERDVTPNSGIVRVRSTNYQQLLFVGFTTPVTRPRGFKAAVSFGEVERGQPLPIVAWYPIGSNRGYQFLYR